MTRFTDRVQNVIQIAQERAESTGLKSISPECLLEGLVILNEGVASQVLQNLRLSDKITKSKCGRSETSEYTSGNRNQEMREVHPLERKPLENFPLSLDAKKVLELAVKEDEVLKFSYVGTEHILLGYIKFCGGILKLPNQCHSVDYETVKKEVESILGLSSATPDVIVVGEESLSRVILKARQELDNLNKVLKPELTENLRKLVERTSKQQ